MSIKETVLKTTIAMLITSPVFVVALLSPTDVCLALIAAIVTAQYLGLSLNTK